jgi:hypothetical protein
MAVSEAYKIAKLNARAVREASQMEVFKEIVRSPAVELVAAFVAIEILQRIPSERPILGSMQGTLMETGIAGLIGLQQLAPLLPALLQAGEGAADIVKSFAPMIASGAALAAV